MGRLLAVCAIALSAANCAKNPAQIAQGAGGSDIDPKYGVRASRRLYSEGDTIPKGGGRRFSGKPYVVAGRTYVPREDARGYVREGLASWYGSAFHGRLTANGEVFDRQSIAAAHPTLPLPSYVRVTNVESGRSMVVRVNDRGPYHENRIMDVSEEAARALDFHRRGTARVRVEYLGRASIAGSDDRKLLATLRTDGRPASAGPSAPVMMADLGPDAAEAPRMPNPEHFAKPARPALAFRPTQEEPPEAQPRPRPIIVASRSSVAVPAAVQPTAPRTASFRPGAVVREPAPVQLAARHAPLSLAPPPLKLAAAPEGSAAKRKFGSGTRQAALAGHAIAPSAGRSGAAMPDAAKLAMARLAAESAGKGGLTDKSGGHAGKAAAVAETRPQRRRLAGID